MSVIMCIQSVLKVENYYASMEAAYTMNNLISFQVSACRVVLCWVDNTLPRNTSMYQEKSTWQCCSDGSWGEIRRIRTTHCKLIVDMFLWFDVDINIYDTARMQAHNFQIKTNTPWTPPITTATTKMGVMRSNGGKMRSVFFQSPPVSPSFLPFLRRHFINNSQRDPLSFYREIDIYRVSCGTI